MGLARSEPAGERIDEEQREYTQRIAKRREHNEANRKPKRKAKRLRRESEVSARRYFAKAHGLLFDRNLAREQVILPEVLCFEQNFAETAAVIETMRRVALHEGRPILLHFDRVNDIDPAAALAIVAEIFRIRNLRSPSALTGTYPRMRVIYDLLSDMGFFQLLNIEERYGPPEVNEDLNRPIFLRFLSSNQVLAEAVDSFVGIIEKHLFPMNAVARGKLVAAIIEAMNNTLDHAHPVVIAGETMPRRWWMSSWVNIVDREVMIMLFDQGVGIPKTLDPALYERVRAALSGAIHFRALTATPTDGEMIMAATELYRTGTGQPGRGRGFRNMKQFVDACTDGELRVLSNRGRYSYIPGTETYGNESLSVGGTIIQWRFRHTGSVEMDDE